MTTYTDAYLLLCHHFGTPFAMATDPARVEQLAKIISTHGAPARLTRQEYTDTAHLRRLQRRHPGRVIAANGYAVIAHY